MLRFGGSFYIAILERKKNHAHAFPISGGISKDTPEQIEISWTDYLPLQQTLPHYSRRFNLPPSSDGHVASPHSSHPRYIKYGPGRYFGASYAVDVNW